MSEEQKQNQNPEESKNTEQQADTQTATEETSQPVEAQQSEAASAQESGNQQTASASADENQTETGEEAAGKSSKGGSSVPEPRGFYGDVEGDTYSLEEIESSMEEYDDSEYKELMNMYEGTLSSIDEKEIVKGRVASVDEKYVVVDIGFKSEGIVPLNEFPESEIENLAPGDEIEVFLDKVEDKEGQLILSRKKADILNAWERIEEAFESEEVIEGYIKRRIKGGMVVDVFGIDAFLPGSQIDVRPVRDFDAYVGKTMEFQVVKLNMQAENVVVSHRALIESDLEEQRQKILETIESGQVLEGVVKNVTDFGVFIDLGGVDGLLHITDLSWGRVEHPSEIVQLDQRLNVAVIDFDDNSKRVSLGLKQLQPHPWNEIDNKYPEGIRVQGRVVSIADYGAFIELEKGVEGLIHISEMSWTQHIKHPSQLVEKDDIIECVVLNVNKEEKKISLGVKQLEKDPWEDLLDRYPIGSQHTGKVRNLTNFGVFVELEPGIDGLVHISDLSWTKKINHPGEMIERGDDIQVVILDVDFDNRRITLGHKQIEENPWEKYAEEYQPGNEVKGSVSKVTDKGAFVTLDLGVDAFLPGSKIQTEEDQAFNEVIKEGQEVEAFVLEFDEPNKNITLTQNEKDVNKFKRSEEKAGKGQSESSSGGGKAKSRKGGKPESGGLTLGEMSGLEDLREQLLEQEKEEGQSKSSSSAKQSSSSKSTSAKKQKKEQEDSGEATEAGQQEASQSESEAEAAESEQDTETKSGKSKSSSTSKSTKSSGSSKSSSGSKSKSSGKSTKKDESSAEESEESSGTAESSKGSSSKKSQSKSESADSGDSDSTTQDEDSGEESKS